MNHRPWRPGRLLLAAAGLVLVAASAPQSQPNACYADCSDALSAENDRGPSAGDPAPDFTAFRFEPAAPAQLETLETLLDGRPLILAFGSYT